MYLKIYLYIYLQYSEVFNYIYICNKLEALGKFDPVDRQNRHPTNG